MKKKDWIVILIILGLAAGIFAALKISDSMNKKQEFGKVIYNNQVLFYFDVNKNDTYEFEGAYGHMHLEVKDGSFRVYDVECPNQTCVGMGWIHKDDLFASIGIVCIPNQIIVVYEAEE